jgi:Tol biopolymer transport system component
MKTRRIFSIILIFLGILIFVSTASSCKLLATGRFTPDMNEDIIFKVWDNGLYQNGDIAFMQNDGSNIKTIQTDPYATMPVWSFNKANILYLLQLNSSSPSLFGKIYTSDGRIICSAFIFYGRTKWISENQILTVRADSNNGIYYHPQIVYYDMNKCKIDKTIHQEATYDYFGDPDYSSTGMLVFTRTVDKQQIIQIYNSETDVLSTVSEGFGGSWSPDGTQLVFTGKDGLYIADSNGGNIRKVIDLTSYYGEENGSIIWDNHPPMAVWSPDSKYLVYHREGNGTYVIAKLEISTGIETILYTGGIYPDWK